MKQRSKIRSAEWRINVIGSFGKSIVKPRISERRFNDPYNVCTKPCLSFLIYLYNLYF